MLNIQYLMTCHNESHSFNIKPRILFLRNVKKFSLDLIHILIDAACSCSRCWGRQQAARVPYSCSLSSPFSWINGVQVASCLVIVDAPKPGFICCLSFFGGRYWYRPDCIDT
ncbi:hypothetical protein ACF0H5_007785 [Mactra antiquata]